jgi:hypothetical protein
MTSAQKATLKTAIQADPTANTFYVNGDLTGLAGYLNALASPVFRVWKSIVSVTEVGDNIVATELAGLTTLNATRLQTIAMYSGGGINPALADRRAFFDDVFSGAGGTLTRPKLLALWKRDATRFEKVFAVGTGSDAVPATLVLESPVSTQDLVGL